MYLVTITTKIIHVLRLPFLLYMYYIETDVYNDHIHVDDLLIPLVITVDWIYLYAHRETALYCNKSDVLEEAKQDAAKSALSLVSLLNDPTEANYWHEFNESCIDEELEKFRAKAAEVENDKGKFCVQSFSQ